MTRAWSANEVVDLKFNSNKNHRFYLKCNWGNPEDRSLIFILLNPSISDSSRCDPTISKCIKIAKKYRYNCIEVLNLFSIIEAYPGKLPKAISELTEAENKKWIEKIIKSTGFKGENKKVVCAWGDKGFRYNANHEIFKILEKYEVRPYCLGAIGFNQPGHPERKAISSLNLTPYNYSAY